VPIQVPAPVELRVRKKWSRRAKINGYALLVFYIGVLAAGFYVFKGGAWFVFVWGSGLAAGIRYLRAARSLEGADQVPIDEQTRTIIVDYERKIRVDGQREAAHGTLSVAPVETDGELSVVADAGSLSKPEED
jgi:hypothetical protein